MYEKILILDNANYIKHNLKELKGIIERESPAVIPISDAAFLLLRSEGINCIDYHSFEYRNMYADVYDTARKWGMGWYRPGNRDISLSRSYSLGDIIEWSSIYFFSNFLRIYLSLSEIIKSTAPKEIILATADKDIDPREHLAALQSVDLTLLTNILSECLKDLPGPVTFRILKFPYPGAFGEKHIDILKSVAIFVNIILSKIMKLREIILRKRKKILFLDGFHHFYDIMRSSELKGVDKVHLQKVIGPSLLPRLYARGISVYALREGDRKLSWNLPDPDVVKGELKEFFSYQGKDLLAHIWPRLEWILRVYIPETVHPKLISTIRAVEKTRPDCIVTENDSTYQEKMLTLIGRELNIPTVVVQHGSTVCDNSHPGIMVHNFLPLISDVFLAFGKVSRDWFINMNVDPERVVITGAARFDSYYQNKKRAYTDDDHAKTVLILLNDLWIIEGVITDHIGLKVFHEHILKFIELARRNPDVQFIIRPHNNTNLWREVLSEELDSIDNLVLSREEKLTDVFLTTKLVVGYTSTALIEALICKIPAISMDTGEYINYMPLWEYGLSKRAGSFEEVESAIRKLIRDNKERKRCLTQIEENLHLFNYNNDGRAASRIARELGEIVLRGTKNPVTRTGDAVKLRGSIHEEDIYNF